MLKLDDFINLIIPKLKAAYGMQGMFCGDIKTQASIWYESLKDYNRSQVENAVVEYVKSNRFKPNPADIIALMPSKKYDGSDFRPSLMYEDGKRVYKCLKCQDSGMFTWDDEQQNTYGRPCECPAGHYYFTGAWEKLYGIKETQ